MSTARKIFSNVVWQVLGKFAVAGLGMAVIKICTNYLSVEQYGEYLMVYEFLAFFGIAADLGLFTIAVREMSKNEEDIPKIIGNILTLRTILVTITMLAGIGLAFLIPQYQDTRVPIGVAVAAITVFFTIQNGTITSVLQAKLKMGQASFTTVIAKIFSVSFMAYIAFFGFPNDKELGFYMLIVAGIFGAIINYAHTRYYVKKITPLKYRFDLDLWKKVLITSLPYGIALILNTIYFRIGSMMIFMLRDQQEVGVYGVAMRMLENFAIIPLYFMNSVLPVLTKSLKEKSDHYRQLIKHSFDFLAAMAVPMVVGVVVLAYPIIFIVASPEFLSRTAEGFYGSDAALQILIFALLFQFINILFSFLLIALDKQSKLLYINAGCVLFNIIGNFIAIPLYGFRGASFMAVLNELFMLIACYFVARYYLNFTINLKNLFKIIFSGLVMGVIVYYLQPITYIYLQNWNIFPLAVLGALLYFAILYSTGVINKDILNLLKKGSDEPREEMTTADERVL